MKSWLLLLSCVMVSACALGPNYSRPRVDAPTAYRWQLENPSSSSIADLGWWQVYEDPTLQALISAAVANNFDVRIAAARIEQARATLGSTRYQLLPDLSVTGSASRARTSEYKTLPGFPTLGNTFNAQGNLSYELDFWGRYRRANEAARADLLAARYGQKSVLVSLIAQVASSYFNLLSFDEQLDITKRTLDIREKFVELTRARHDRGVVSGLDVATAEAQLESARANIPDLERQIALEENALSVLLGKNPSDIVRQPQAMQAHANAPMPPAGMPSDLLNRRPDILEAEQNLVTVNAQVGVAKAALFPSISLTGAAGSTSSALSNLFDGPSRTWSLGGSLLLPLLDPQRNIYELEFAKARKREYILRYQSTIQTAFREVADALIGQQKNVEFQQAQGKQVDALRQAQSIALERYRIGYSSYFDVISADRDLFAAELTLSNAHRAALLSSVELYRALGGGWQVEEK
jgi:multidrug efflux system outer membrane protein